MQNSGRLMSWMMPLRSKRQWAATERRLLQKIEVLTQNLGNVEHQLDVNSGLWRQKVQNAEHQWKQEKVGLEAELHEASVKEHSSRIQLDNFVLKQQEISFKQMNSTRWDSMDDSKAIHELHRLKKDMRNWAKANTAENLSPLLLLDKTKATSIHQLLHNVVAFDGERLPEEIMEHAKAPLVLLSAILAHDIYECFFVSPFSFLGKMSSQLLTQIYQNIHEATEQEAHFWRAQTLRLLKPPINQDSSASKIKLRQGSEGSLLMYARNQAMCFANGPAKLLMSGITTEGAIDKLNRIYAEAAEYSYQLWARRINMVCLSMKQMESLKFNAESTNFDLDPLVKYGEDQSELNGEKIVVMMHPVLTVYGNDEGGNYDRACTWAKGVVFLVGKKNRDLIAVEPEAASEFSSDQTNGGQDEYLS